MAYIDVVQTGEIGLEFDENFNLTIDAATAKLLNEKIRDVIENSFPNKYVYMDENFKIFSEDRTTTYTYEDADDWIFDLEMTVEVDASSGEDHLVSGDIVYEEVDDELFTKNFKALPIIGEYIRHVDATVFSIDDDDIDWAEVAEREKDEALDDEWDLIHER